MKLERKNGEIKGEIKGKIKGEKQKSIEIAKKLLRMGMTVEKVMDATGLTNEEIEKIK